MPQWGVCKTTEPWVPSERRHLMGWYLKGEHNKRNFWNPSCPKNSHKGILLWPRGLRIQHCHYSGPKSHFCGGTSTGRRHGQKKKKKRRRRISSKTIIISHFSGKRLSKCESSSRANYILHFGRMFFVYFLCLADNPILMWVYLYSRSSFLNNPFRSKENL